MFALFPTTTTTVTRRLLLSSSSSSSRRIAVVIGNPSSSISLSRRCLSTHGQEAVDRLKHALEQYRVQNYQQEIPSRFKKDIIKGCSLTSPIINNKVAAANADERTMAVEGIEQLLRNIGIFGNSDDRTTCITHDDVETIVTECHQDQQQQQQQIYRADQILLQLL